MFMNAVKAMESWTCKKSIKERLLFVMDLTEEEYCPSLQDDFRNAIKDVVKASTGEQLEILEKVFVTNFMSSNGRPSAWSVVHDMYHSAELRMSVTPENYVSLDKLFHLCEIFVIRESEWDL